jgi:putative aminopeptidase FrvX
MTDQTFEEVTIKGEKIVLEHRNVPTIDIVLDEDNPRLRYQRAKDGDKPLCRMLPASARISRTMAGCASA